MKRPGRIVKCQDGKIGRTYNDFPLVPVQVSGAIGGVTVNKVQVFVFAESREALLEGETISPPQRRLCLPTDLKIIGFAD